MLLTKGVVESEKCIIKTNTVRRIKFKSINKLKSDLSFFLGWYSLYILQTSLRKELNLKIPINAI
jgi:hypothetical protein